MKTLVLAVKGRVGEGPAAIVVVGNGGNPGELEGFGVGGEAKSGGGEPGNGGKGVGGDEDGERTTPQARGRGVTGTGEEER